MRDLLRADQTQMELQNELWTSERRHFDSIGSVLACMAIFEKVQDELADGQTRNEFMNVGQFTT